MYASSPRMEQPPALMAPALRKFGMICAPAVMFSVVFSGPIAVGSKPMPMARTVLVRGCSFGIHLF